MNISDETLKLLDIVITNNPKYSPKGHPSDYSRWIEFVIASYLNNDFIDEQELYNYFIKNGFEKFKEQAKGLVDNYVILYDFISHINNYKNDNFMLSKTKYFIKQLNEV